MAGLSPAGIKHIALPDNGPDVPREGARQVRARVTALPSERGFRSHEDVLENVRSIRWGKRSHLMDEELVGRMLIELPTAIVAKFDTGHSIPFEGPAEFTAQLMSFLRDEHARIPTY